MSHSVSQIASALLPSATLPMAVDTLFPAATRAIIGKVPVSPAVAHKFVKGPIAQAVAIAGCRSTDQDTLALCAKDSRVSVREALLMNPSTPVDTVLKLAAWAFGRDTDAVSAAVAARISPEDAVDQFERWFPAKRDPRYMTALVRTVVRKTDNNQELTTRLLATGHPDVAARIAYRIATGKSNAMTVTRMLELLPERAQRAAVQAVLSRSAVLTVEVANAVVKVSPLGLLDLVPENVTMVEPGSLEVLATASLSMFASALALGLNETSVLEVIDTASESGQAHRFLKSTVTSFSSRRYSAHAEQELVKRLIREADRHRGSVEEVSCSLLPRLGSTIPSDLMVRWVRTQGERFTQLWLTGLGGANAPKRGELPAVLEQPGFAFGRNSLIRGAGGALESHTEPGNPSEYAGRIARTIGWASSTTGRQVLLEDDLLEYLDEFLGQQLADPDCAPLAMPVVERHLGDQSEAWGTFLALAADWQGRLTDLVGAALDLSGSSDMSLRDRADQCSPGKLPAHEQLAVDVLH